MLFAKPKLLSDQTFVSFDYPLENGFHIKAKQPNLQFFINAGEFYYIIILNIIIYLFNEIVAARYCLILSQSELQCHSKQDVRTEPISTLYNNVIIL